jgi:hypothetical protein
MHYGLHEIDGPNGKLLGWAAGFFLSPSLPQTLKGSGLIFSSRRSKAPHQVAVQMKRTNAERKSVSKICWYYFLTSLCTRGAAATGKGPEGKSSPALVCPCVQSAAHRWSGHL